MCGMCKNYIHMYLYLYVANLYISVDECFMEENLLFIIHEKKYNNLKEDKQENSYN